MSDSLERLHAAILDLRRADPSRSRTARLMQAGQAKISKKLAEEAVEVIIDAMQGDREAVIRESADLLYHLVALWVSSEIRPQEIWAEMTRREQMFGLAEKLPKKPAKNDSFAKTPKTDLFAAPPLKKVALGQGPLHKRR